MNNSEMILDASENRGEPDIPAMDENMLLQTIWLQPRNTLLFIINRRPNKMVTFLLVLGGAVAGLNNALEGGDLFIDSAYIKLAVGLLAGAIFGAVANMLIAAILAWSGRLIGGTGRYQRVLPAVAWSLVPTIAQIIPIFLMLGYFGVDVAVGYVDLSTTSSQILFYILLFLELCLTIWSALILITGLSIAHRFGIGKAVLNVLIPVLIILIPLAIIAFIAGDLFNPITS
jgi:hypothetical protein